VLGPEDARDKSDGEGLKVFAPRDVAGVAA
jgi:hypothetical protein